MINLGSQLVDLRKTKNVTIYEREDSRKIQSICSRQKRLCWQNEKFCISCCFWGNFQAKHKQLKQFFHKLKNEPNESIKYSKFEPFMIQILKCNEYDPDDTDTLLAAFKQLNEEKKGYIEIDTLKQKLISIGYKLNIILHKIQFRQSEIEDFIQFATNRDPNYKTHNQFQFNCYILPRLYFETSTLYLITCGICEQTL